MSVNWAVIPPKTTRGYESLYKEHKIAAHTTVSGQGKIARLRQRQRKKKRRG